MLLLLLLLLLLGRIGLEAVAWGRVARGLGGLGSRAGRQRSPCGWREPEAQYGACARAGFCPGCRAAGGAWMLFVIQEMRFRKTA